MTKNYLFLLLGLLLAACSSDDKDEQPILVTNVVMPASGTVFPDTGLLLQRRSCYAAPVK